MILCDTGPLFALLDKKQTENHLKCNIVFSQLTEPLITTWPCFTEAMYFLYKEGGWTLQKLLWRFVNDSILNFYSLTFTDINRMQKLMEKYQNVPMDVADASLVAAAEALAITRIFTLDSDFWIYQIGDNTPFEIIP